MSNALTVSVPDGVPFIDTAREFDVPVAAVFQAFQDPELIKRWLGPDGYEMDVERYDFSTGGGYRYIHRDPQGGEYAFNGVFHTVRENELAIQTFEFEGFPDVVAIETLTFTDLGDGRSRLSTHSVYPNQEARDGMAASGMEDGMNQGYAKLDAVVAELTAAG